ncbi:MAG TPA: hypothetical protein VJ724_00225 [Tahibacter sp.]|nr:hypothetical protein [Tahibacter sp.]
MKLRKLIVAGALALGASAAHAQVVITQASVLAGGLSGSDTPGFPATLDEAGLYVLESNLTPPAATNAIDITGRNVTLDLNGFVIDGGNRCTETGPNGNSCQGLLSDGTALVNSDDAVQVRVRNGSVIGGTGRGISLRNFHIESPGVDVSNVYTAHNVAAGIGIELEGARLDRVQSTLNGSDGVYTYGEALLSGVRTSRNGLYGTYIEGDAAVRGLLTTHNIGDGIFSNGVLHAVEASNNANDGINTSLVVNARASDNGGNGAYLGLGVYEAVLTNNAFRAYANVPAASGGGCYGRLYVRTTSTMTPQVQDGVPMNGTVTACP